MFLILKVFVRTYDNLFTIYKTTFNFDICFISCARFNKPFDAVFLSLDKTNTQLSAVYLTICLLGNAKVVLLS